MQLKYLNQTELAERWKISYRTLERWRWSGGGPRFVKIGHRILYRLEDIEAFEREQRHTSTADYPSKSAV